MNLTMRCIFCKQNSSTSITIEHIVPESLGNKDHILPAGIVCDSCNRYFGLKIEKPLLDSDYFRQARFRNTIQNKEGRIPTIQGILLPGFVPIEMCKDKEGLSILPSRENDLDVYIKSLRSSSQGRLIFPVAIEPNHHLMSRFLSKVALEVFAFQMLEVEGAIDEIIDKRELDELRKYARFGGSPAYWPLSIRPIYSEGEVFIEEIENYEVLHEFDILYTKSNELYIVLAVFGIEYVLNMGEREIEGYKDWLTQHGFKSPLYVDHRSEYKQNM